MIRKLDNANEIKERFIAPVHYDGLVKYMQNEKLIVAFRPAGRFSIDKMQLGAAPKPHCILDKTIKPCEVGLTQDNTFLFTQNSAMDIDNPIKAKNLLCGLVGTRAGGTINGLYLTPEGKTFFTNNNFNVQDIGEDGRYSCVKFDDFSTLEDVLGSMFADAQTVGYSKLRYFVTGDYDLHEILRVEDDRKVVHLVADQWRELDILCGLSDAAMSGVANRGKGAHMEETKDGKKFISEIYSPIQHGAQDNYVDHTLNQEADVRIVDKVAVPASDIAFFNGMDCSWTVINNEPAGSGNLPERELIIAAVTQGKEIAEYLRGCGAEPAPWWDLKNDEQLAALVNTFGKTFLEVLWSYMD